MKRARSTFKKRLSLVLSLVMLLGFLPLVTGTAAETAPGASFTATKDAAGVTATLNNLSAAGIDASFLLAVYMSDGQLVYCKEYQVTVGAQSTASQRFDYDIAAHPDYIVKVFAWDRVTFVPLCKDMTSALCVTVDGSGVIYDGMNVMGTAGATKFTYVKVDEFTKRGKAFTATKSGSTWTHAKADGVDVVIAYRPAKYIGSTLPVATMTELRMPNGVNRKRIVITL